MAPIAEADIYNSTGNAYPANGIDILIVGTGLAGLTAALECHRKGMGVRILERSTTINTTGDMLFLGLSATTIFKHWPTMEKEFKEISLHDAYIETRSHTGKLMVPPMRVADRLRSQGLDPSKAPGTFQMRALLYKMLLNQVERVGIKIEFNQQVVDYYEDQETRKGGVIIKGGKKYEADVVIAADGVGSKSQSIVGGQVKAVHSGRAIWRVAFPIEHIEQNPEVKEFFGLMNGQAPVVRTFNGPLAYCITLTRPGFMVWVMNHNITGSEEESWNNTVKSSEVLEQLQKDKWAPILIDLVKCIPEKTIVNFNLLWRNPQPTWTSPGSRIIQIGDSAHSFLPSSGNGATQAIEDAVSLATCLQMGGKENISQSIQAHIRLRFIRVACCQKIGFVNAELLQETDWDKVKIDPRRSSPQNPSWVFNHDAEVYAEENYAQVLKSIEQGVPFDEDDSFPSNYPLGYKYEPWSIEEIIENKKQGKAVELGSGNWGIIVV